MNQGGVTDAMNIAIGHDIGGLVARQIDRGFSGSNKRYGGVITVGAPNRGAYIFNSFDNGDAQMMIDHAFSEMNGAIYGFGAQNKAQEFVRKLLNEALLGQLIDPLSAVQNSPIGQDLPEGSALIDDINNAQTETPTISIWGMEESPVNWRLASSQKSDALDDNEFVRLRDEARTHYRNKRNVNIALGGLASFLCVFGGGPSHNDGVTSFGCLFAAYSGLQAVQWQRGVTWLDKSETFWMDVIGCSDRDENLTSITYTVTPYLQICGGYYTGSVEWQACINQFCFGNLNSPQCAPYELTHYFTIVGDLPSDDLLCQHTQIVPDLPFGNFYRADGVNHREETNTGSGTTLNGNDEIRRIFNVVWVREDIFSTPVR